MGTVSHENEATLLITKTFTGLKGSPRECELEFVFKLLHYYYGVRSPYHATHNINIAFSSVDTHVWGRPPLMTPPPQGREAYSTWPPYAGPPAPAGLAPSAHSRGEEGREERGRNSRGTLTPLARQRGRRDTRGSRSSLTVLLSSTHRKDTTSCCQEWTLSCYIEQITLQLLYISCCICFTSSEKNFICFWNLAISAGPGLACWHLYMAVVMWLPSRELV